MPPLTQHLNQSPDTPKHDDEPRGILCPRCGCTHFRVLYTRAKPGGRIMRRRECRHCGRRVTTWEA